MITILFHLTTKPGADNEARAVLSEMTQVSRRDDGCISYVFHQQRDDRRQWVLYEQWRDKAALEAHAASMKASFGEPPPGARLPARLHAVSEAFHYHSYDVLP
jgi:quinol monooxygenase YgiN